MELLGNANKQVNLITKAQELNKKLLSSSTIKDQDLLNDSISFMVELADSNDSVLMDPKITSLIFTLSDTKDIEEFPILKNLVTEIRLRFVRLNIFGDVNVAQTTCDCAIDNEKKIERWVPDYENEFTLPPKGQTTNLTVTEPNFEVGKRCIREVIIDDQGYLVREISRRYEDIYTDESEEAFNEKYLEEIRKDK